MYILDAAYDVTGKLKYQIYLFGVIHPSNRFLFVENFTIRTGWKLKKTLRHRETLHAEKLTVI